MVILFIVFMLFLVVVGVAVTDAVEGATCWRAI